jgi:hypothetical protein
MIIPIAPELKIIEGKFKFALSIGNVHLPYFSHVEAGKISECLNKAGSESIPFSFVRDKEGVDFTPSLSGIQISVYLIPETGGVEKPYAHWDLDKDGALALRDKIDSRLAKKAT